MSGSGSDVRFEIYTRMLKALPDAHIIKEKMVGSTCLLYSMCIMYYYMYIMHILCAYTCIVCVTRLCTMFVDHTCQYAYHILYTRTLYTYTHNTILCI